VENISDVTSFFTPFEVVRLKVRLGLDGREWGDISPLLIFNCAVGDLESEVLPVPAEEPLVPAALAEVSS
jgi:hypothetical protein